MRLETHSSEPLYIQLKDLLRAAIEDGSLPPGARVPSERELAQSYNVSRMTARQALQLLAHEGFTYSRVGKGTYVKQPKIPQELQHLTSFSEEMARLGLKASSKILKAQLEPAAQSVARKLGLVDGADVLLLVRVRCGDDEPMAVETTYLNPALCPNILTLADFSRRSLYDVLRHEYALSMVRAEQVIEARLPNAREMEALNITASVPVLELERTTFDIQGRAVEFVRSVYRGDKYQFRTVLHATEWTAAPLKKQEFDHHG